MCHSLEQERCADSGRPNPSGPPGLANEMESEEAKDYQRCALRAQASAVRFVRSNVEQVWKGLLGSTRAVFVRAGVFADARGIGELEPRACGPSLECFCGGSFQWRVCAST